MAFLQLLVLCFTGTTLISAPVESKKSLLSDARNSAKLLRAQEAGRNLAILIRNLEIKTPADGLKFVDAINEMVYKTETTLSELSQAIPSVKNKPIHDTLVEFVLGIGDLARQVQLHLHGPHEKLKERFADTVDKSVVYLGKIAQIFESEEFKKEVFLLNQLRRIFNRSIYAFIKLKLETEFFHKPNKDLESEIDSFLESFCKSLQNVKNDDARAKDELVYLIEELQNVQNLAYIKLKNFEHINDGDDKTTATVKEMIQNLSSSFESVSQLTRGSHEVAQLKTEFEKIFRAGHALVKKLAGCDVAESTPGEYYIRSSIFDGIALSKFCERELSELEKVQGITAAV